MSLEENEHVQDNIPTTNDDDISNNNENIVVQPEEQDEEMDDEFNDNIETDNNNVLFNNNDETSTKQELDDGTNNKLFEIPEFTRKDKTLNELLNMMETNIPIIPDEVIDYYMSKNGFKSSDVRVKRLLALATQKFISDIASDAYEYSRIRSATAVYNANNGQNKARQLLINQQQQTSSSNASNQQLQDSNKVVLTVNDLSSAVSEYGLNISRPDFYR